nr:BrnT family toxin [uncultured Moraxella sp.]
MLIRICSWIEWDENKNQSNKQKHKVSFELAQLVFFDENCLTETDFVKDGEQRW